MSEDQPTEDNPPGNAEDDTGTVKGHPSAGMVEDQHNRLEIAGNKFKGCIDVDKYRCKRKFPRVKPWITELRLSLEDQKILASPMGWLNDKIVDAAQTLLRNAHPAVPGLQPVSLGATCAFDIQTGEFVQVLHDGTDHWLLISTIGVTHPAEVYVYDSMYSSASSSLQMQIASLLHTEHSSIILNYRDVQRQRKGDDCGLFAIAFATSLIHGIKPEECVFDQAQMRSHLMQCIEDRCLTVFPVTKSRRKTAKARVKGTQQVHVYCTCRMPAVLSAEWIQCSTCGEWFHQSCVRVPKECFKKEIAWYCSGCS